ncbi:class I-like SAM-binding methyltransferase superfamily [Asimina triloba]
MAGRPSAGGAPVDKGADFANYFCTYAFLYHQKEMLSDRVRMDAYNNAIFYNPNHFRGKVPAQYTPLQRTERKFIPLSAESRTIQNFGCKFVRKDRNWLFLLYFICNGERR